MAQSCENVGCDIGQLSCQIDHIQEWIRDGGETDTDNGAVKCGGHNRSKHRLGITERRDKFGKLIQFRRDGTPITPVGRRLRLDDTTADDSNDSDGWTRCTCDAESPPTLDWPVHRMTWRPGRTHRYLSRGRGGPPVA